MTHRNNMIFFCLFVSSANQERFLVTKHFFAAFAKAQLIVSCSVLKLKFNVHVTIKSNNQKMHLFL